MEQQEKKTSKIKAWWEKNKGKITNDVRTFAWYAGGFILGSWATKNMVIYNIDRGLYQTHIEGMVKFFDPTSGAEISYAEAGKMLMERSKK